jgi:hypothetical protein
MRSAYQRPISSPRGRAATTTHMRPGEPS